ncbi:MAG: sporulation protein YabP [Lachnospiraceae bacterium]
MADYNHTISSMSSAVGSSASMSSVSGTGSRSTSSTGSASPGAMRHGHRLSMNDRAWMHISGVLEVISFDPEEIVLDTEEGRMQINGTGLQVKQLLIENGELEIEGRPDTISYTDVKKPVTTSSIFSRIFR